MTIEAEVEGLTQEVGVLVGEVSELSTQAIALLGAVTIQKDVLTEVATAATEAVAEAAASAATALSTLLVESETPPEDPLNGMEWVKTSTKRKYTYLAASTAWVELGASVVIDNLSLAEQTRTDLASPADNKGAGLIGFAYSVAYGVGSVGRWIKDLALGTGAGLVGFAQDSVDAIVRSILLKSRERVTPEDFGATGTADDWAVFQKALNYCGSTRKRLTILDGNYVFSKKLSMTTPFDIESARTARMRWTNPADCGVLIDFSGSSVGLCEINLPQLNGPAIDNTFSVPGYGPSTFTYARNTRAGIAVKLIGGDRTTLSAHVITGWEDGFHVTPSATRSSNNVNISVNTIDFCVRGMHVFAGPDDTLGVTSLKFEANTIWAKFPIYLSAYGGFINSSTYKINGQAFVNEPDGCGIYTASTRIDTCIFNINWLYAGFGVDSTADVPNFLQCPFLGGDGDSNGVTNDGNSPTVGYFVGNFCEFTIGSVMGIPGGAGAGSVPVAPGAIRVRDAGEYNDVTIRYAHNTATLPIPTTDTLDEETYNGGIGGAQYSTMILCSIVLPALLPRTASDPQYVFHQLTSAGSFRPMKIYPSDTSYSEQGLIPSAQDIASDVNRAIRIKFFNPSDTITTAAGTYQFWLEVA